MSCSNDVSVSNKDLLEKAKNEFNREKRLIIKNLPSATSEKDIHAFMGFNGEFPVDSVNIVKNKNQAVVTLKDPTLVDDAISKLDGTKLDNLTVSVSVYRGEILCLAQLPLNYTESQFHELVSQHGDIDMCFLMRSEKTGESKGYGFVKYNEPIEKVSQIKCALDWKEVEDRLVHCDAIVDSSHTGITFQDLHSKCLIIDNLPKDYNDSIVLRELFSQLVKPVYCQIVTKEGESLGFGIIEYDSSEDTERAFDKFNSHQVNGVPMNISYCIPGKSAVHMFSRIMFKYGDTVHVNKASLLPDPVYPNPAFLKHIFFKTHVAKNPRLLVQFTDNLLHLQEGYVKSLEDRTNAKPGILGPPPVIPMSPLMDINLQLGLLSVIVLDMRENNTYNGDVPDPLGKLKVPSDDEFEEKPQPVSLLGDPMTAQANIIIKNLLKPPDKPEFPGSKSPTSEDTTAKLLGRPVHSLNMVYLCSLGRLMAMLTEKTQAMGILGNAPKLAGVPPKPLMEGLMQAGKVAQKLLNSMGMGQQRNQTMGMGQQGNQSNFMGRNQGEGNQLQGLLGNPASVGQNNSKAASNLLGTIQQLALQKMSQNSPGAGNKMDLKSLFSGMGNLNSNNNSGDGLLGSYKGQDWTPNPTKNPAAKGPQSLLSLNLNNKGEGLIPTPNLDEDSGFGGFHGNLGGGYDDSGYQGGIDDSDYNDGNGNYDNPGFGNYGNQMTPNRMGGRGAGNMMTDTDLGTQTSSGRYDGAYFSGINANQRAAVGTGMNRQSDKREGNYSDIAQKAAFYAAGAAAAYKQQYDDWMQSGYGDGFNNGGRYQSGYSGGFNNGGAQQGYGGGFGNSGEQYGTGSGYSYNSDQGSYGSDMSYGSQQNASFGNQTAGRYGQGGMMRNQYGGSSNTSQMGFPQNTGFSQNTQRNSSNVRPGNNFVGSYGRDGSDTGLGPIGSGPRNLMAPPTSSWGTGTTSSAQATPQGQKRPFSHILPSPEPSPEGDYVGQHSQGLGGHYADTYTKRQKLTGRF